MAAFTVLCPVGLEIYEVIFWWLDVLAGSKSNLTCFWTFSVFKDCHSAGLILLNRWQAIRPSDKRLLESNRISDRESLQAAIIFMLSFRLSLACSFSPGSLNFCSEDYNVCLHSDWRTVRQLHLWAILALTGNVVKAEWLQEQLPALPGDYHWDLYIHILGAQCTVKS